jgi:hypothetical protein
MVVPGTALMASMDDPPGTLRGTGRMPHRTGPMRRVLGGIRPRQVPITSSDRKNPNVAVVWIQLVAAPRL